MATWSTTERTNVQFEYLESGSKSNYRLSLCLQHNHNSILFISICYFSIASIIQIHVKNAVKIDHVSGPKSVSHHIQQPHNSCDSRYLSLSLSQHRNIGHARDTPSMNQIWLYEVKSQHSTTILPGAINIFTKFEATAHDSTKH